MVLLNRSNYDNHFIIRELPEDFEGQFECSGENSKKYIPFSVPIKKQKENGARKTYKVKFIDKIRSTVS